MNLKSVTYFLAACAEGSFTDAAKMCGVSQLVAAGWIDIRPLRLALRFGRVPQGGDPYVSVFSLRAVLHYLVDVEQWRFGTSAKRKCQCGNAWVPQLCSAPKHSGQRSRCV